MTLTVVRAIGLTLGGTLVTVLALWSSFSRSKLKAQAKFWGQREAWRLTTCEVLAAGVSCAGDQLVCTSGAEAGFMPQVHPPVFPSAQLSTCPGTFWCAREQEMCNCKGQITYATELFDGSTYTTQQLERYTVSSSGSWRCGTDQMGVQFQVDPAPGTTKHCWCTPAHIQQILQTHHSSGAVHKRSCATSATADFHSFRRLAPKRRLPSLGEALSRRRRATYDPWALVAVPSDMGMQLTCAYEYGVPEASALIDTDAGKSNGVAQSWGSSPSRPCWVRTGPGIQAQASQASLGAEELCAVALLLPPSLKDAVGSMQWYDTLWVALGFILTLLGGALTVFLCLTEGRAPLIPEESQGLVGTPLRTF